MERLNDDKLRQIEAWLQEAAGMDEASLLKAAADAQRELEQEKRNMTSEEADRMEQKLDLEAYILMARLEENGIRPITMEEYENRNRGQKRSWCKEKRLKAGMLAAAVVGVALIGGISSIAKSEYRYAQYPGQGGGSVLIRYNTAIEFKVGGCSSIMKMARPAKSKNLTGRLPSKNGKVKGRPVENSSAGRPDFIIPL